MTPRAHSIAPPSVDDTLRALRLVAEALGTDDCYWYGGRFHFNVGHPYSLAIKPESAGRFRLEACRYTRARGTLFSFATDEARLVALACELRDVVTQQIGEVA